MQLRPTITQDNLVCSNLFYIPSEHYLFRRSLGVRFSGDTAEHLGVLEIAGSGGAERNRLSVWFVWCLFCLGKMDASRR